MEPSTTGAIVEALTKAIVEHRLQPGSKLAEQKLADHFGVSRTLVRQALFQLSQNRLIRLEPARGAFVAAPAVDEARQVFAVRRMLEAEMTRAFVREVTPAQHQGAARPRGPREGGGVRRTSAPATNCSATSTCAWPSCMGNEVLAQMLSELVSRCALITLMYQQPPARPSIPTTNTTTS